MTRYLAPLLVLTLVSCAAASKGDAQEGAVPEPTVQVSDHGTTEPLGRKMSSFVEVRAKVLEVNYKERLLTLKGSDGKVEKLKVDEAVKRLNEVKVGDMVLVQYYVSVAFEVRPPTEEEKKNPKSMMAVAGKSEPGMDPSAGALVRVKAIVTIEAIDRTAQTVTIKGPSGGVATIKAQHPENLEKVKVGDTVAVEYSEALAVALEPVKGKK